MSWRLNNLAMAPGLAAPSGRRSKQERDGESGNAGRDGGGAGQEIEIARGAAPAPSSRAQGRVGGRNADDASCEATPWRIVRLDKARLYPNLHGTRKDFALQR